MPWTLSSQSRPIDVLFLRLPQVPLHVHRSSLALRGVSFLKSWHNGISFCCWLLLWPSWPEVSRCERCLHFFVVKNLVGMVFNAVQLGYFNCGWVTSFFCIYRGLQVDVQLFLTASQHLSQISLWERITYKLRTCSLSKSIISELLLNSNCSMENF